MKTLIITLALILSPLAVADVNLYAEAYRFDEVNHTGVAGLEVNDYNIEYGIESGKLSIGKRHYLGFTNIEIGVESMLTTDVHANAVDWRVMDIEGGYHYVAKPYIKAGDKLFVSVSIDETNTAVIKVGFELW